MITHDELQLLKYPIGTFEAPEQINSVELENLIRTIEGTVSRYRALTENLSENDLKKTYRDGAWTVQQLVNHVADMQLLHFFRMKKALTEPDYKEITLVDIPAWAHTVDGLQSPVADSLDMMESITKRFVRLMRSLDGNQQQIAYYHPIRKIMLNQKQAIAMTAWHVRHHFEHIRIALGQR
ncbi:MAG TPA: DinB family protein [Ohtaekwangia sp.]